MFFLSVSRLKAGSDLTWLVLKDVFDWFSSFGQDTHEESVQQQRCGHDSV